MSSYPAGVLLAATGAAHLAFQATVSVVVYPALAAVPRDRWQTAHADHSRRITWVVAPLYVAVAAACSWSILTGPSPWQWVAVGGNAFAALTTAAVAAPTHRRLAGGHDPVLLRRLLAADLVRTTGALVAAVAGILAIA